MKPGHHTPVPSPCISICEMGADGLCKGCLRTIDEIAAWGSAGDDARRAILAAIVAREQTIPFDTRIEST